MKEGKKIAETPLMLQYFEIKAKYPEALLLFRVGDFYETFGDDAIKASKILGIVLTKRANGAASSVELAGFPHHSLDTYLPKLVRAGLKVAVCDQLEDPKLTKKIVKRGVTELVTPGVAFSDQLLSQKENNYLASVCFSKDRGGVAFVDISTGEFKVAEGDLDYMDQLLSSLSPKEVLIQKGYEKGFMERFGKNLYLTPMDEWAFVYHSGREKLKQRFTVDRLKGFGVEEMELGITAAGAILFYLELTQHSDISQLCSISRIDQGNSVWMDKFTVRNLEIFNSYTPEGVSLLDVIDRSSSPMGARMLRYWIAFPLTDLNALKKRHDAVASLEKQEELRQDIQQMVREIGDMERIVSKAAAGKILPREILQLKRGLNNIGPIKNSLKRCMGGSLSSIIQRLDDCSELSEAIEKTIARDAAAQIGKGRVIASGVDAQLDELCDVVENGKEIVLRIQQREVERTGITSLKISYNNVFGYYLEVRNTHKDKVPPDWIRKQTLVSAERYITQELKDYEEKILGAEQKILEIEQKIYNGMVGTIRDYIATIQNNSKAIGELDCLLGFAQSAQEYSYCRPDMDESQVLDIKRGRHPVIERSMPHGEDYIPNDLHLDSGKQQIIILTGPNMAGKSALLRQTALIVLMAQIGSFVPADSARIGYCDKIFTRVGASDNISRGESTFMVEMLETSTILHNISQRSLVLLDEIGRGTSTYDGMSIAWAIVEYIHQYGRGAKTLFATHYHELNDLEELLPRVKNFHIAVKEIDGKILFIRELRKGGVAHSFGIHVARLAGMPSKVVSCAERKLKELELFNTTSGQAAHVKSAPLQLSLYQLDDPLLLGIKETLSELDINSISPLEAFDLLRDLKKRLNI